MEFIFVYITASSEEESKKIAEKLLEDRLIACANIFPIDSVYRWEGSITEEREFVLIAKTEEGKYDEVKKRVKEIHSYEVPCITEIPIRPNDEYGGWLKGEVE